MSDRAHSNVKLAELLIDDEILQPAIRSHVFLL